MKLKLLGFLALVMMNGIVTQAQTIWTGTPITITKTDSADWTLAVNQDRITDSIWITRKHSMAFYNIAQESGFAGNISPKGTEWAVGSIDSIATLTFQPFIKAANNNPQGLLDTPMVLHLIREDIYIDFKLLSFSGKNKGGFSYQRSTDPTASIPNIEGIKPKFYPNPTAEYLHLSVEFAQETVEIYATNGKVVKTLVVPKNGKLDVMELASGVYYIKMNRVEPIRFLKI